MTVLELVFYPARQRDAFADACAWGDQISVCLGWLEGGDAQGPSWDVLEPHLDKVQVAVVGFGFMRSEPSLLRTLYDRGVLRIVASTDGGYAPNAFVFRRGDRLRALVGSAPFSTTAHEESVEAMVVYEGEAQDAFALQALSLVERCRSVAHLPTLEELEEYSGARRRELVRMRGVTQAPLSMRAKRFHAPELEDLHLVTDRAVIKRGMVAVVEAFEHACSWEGLASIKVRREWRDTWLHWLQQLQIWGSFERDEEQFTCAFGIEPDDLGNLESDLDLSMAVEGFSPTANAAFAQRGADAALFLVYRGARQGRSFALSPEIVARLGGGVDVAHDGGTLRAVAVANVLSPDFPAAMTAFGRELKSCLEVLP